MDRNRTRDYYRKQRAKHINRKKRIIHEQNDYWYYKYSGELSKGKIHCSCGLCRAKVREQGYKISDIRKLDKVNYGLTELE